MSDHLHERETREEVAFLAVRILLHETPAWRLATLLREEAEMGREMDRAVRLAIHASEAVRLHRHGAAGERP